ncbi:tetratricopeptide repeat protein [Thermodesulfobacteriota bacterium]
MKKERWSLARDLYTIHGNLSRTETMVTGCDPGKKLAGQGVRRTWGKSFSCAAIVLAVMLASGCAGPGKQTKKAGGTEKATPKRAEQPAPVSPVEEADPPARQSASKKVQAPTAVINADVLEQVNEAIEAYEAVPRDLETARTILEDVLREHPYDAIVQYNLGVVNQADGLIREAADNYQHALLVDPRLIQARLNLGVLCVEQGRREAAGKHLAMVLDSDPENAVANLYLGKIAAGNGETARAEELINHVIEMDPSLSAAYVELGMIRKALGDTDGAKMNFIHALRQKSIGTADLIRIGNTSMEASMYSLALQAYKTALSRDVTSDAVYNNLGILYRRASEYDKAEEAFKRSIQINPEGEAAYNNLGVMYVLQGRYESALTNYQRALTIHPDSPDILFNCGILHHLYLQDKVQALVLYQRYLTVDGPERDRVQTWIESLRKELGGGEEE